MIADGEVDTVRDQEARAREVAVDRALVEDARRLVSGPVCIHVGAVREQELGNLVVLVQDRPGERHVEHLLHCGRARTDIAVVTAEVAERWLTLLVEPALDAIEIADADGIEAVTMRRIADRLNTGPMSLYRYVPDKDALLSMMIDAVMGDVPLESIDVPADWREGLRLIAESTWQVQPLA